MEIQH